MSIIALLSTCLYFCYRMRRSHRFTGRDVLEAVWNGESDVDIGVSDTDEESDEEEFGEDGTKENQPPTEPTEPNFHIPEPTPCSAAAPRRNKQKEKAHSYEWLKTNFISPNTDFSGPPLTVDVTDVQTPLQYFRFQ